MTLSAAPDRAWTPDAWGAQPWGSVPLPPRDQPRPHRRGSVALRVGHGSQRRDLAIADMEQILFSGVEEVFEVPYWVSTFQQGREVKDTGQALTSGAVHDLQAVRRPTQGSEATNRISLRPMPDGLTTRFVWAESTLEWWHLLQLQWSGVAAAFVTQPALFEWELPARKRIRHFPDFLFVDHEGHRHIRDVKSQRDWHKPQFVVKTLLMDHWCSLHGISYGVLADFPEIWRTNLSHLRMFRDLTIDGESALQQVIQLLQQGPSSVAGVRAASGRNPGALAALQHLMWWREVNFDVRAPLREYSRVSWGTPPSLNEEICFDTHEVWRVWKQHVGRKEK